MEIFVFPLGHIVFYPSISKPLNVMEPRYIQMVRDSIQSGTPIALGHVDEPDREHIYRYGDSLNFVRDIAGFGMPLILEERSDGSLLVFLQGRGKVRLGPTLNRFKPYIVCEAEVISENLEMQSQVVSELAMINKVLLHWLESRVPERSNREHFLQNLTTANDVIGCVASYLVNDNDLQQLLLESNDINEKIKLVSGLIVSGALAES